MEATVFARSTTGLTALDAAAKRIFALLGIEAVEERESSNHTDGHYFLGHAANASLEVCLSDGSAMAEYPFWICVEPRAPWVSEVTRTIEVDAVTIATTLARHGWQVFVPHGNWARKDWDGHGTVYAA